MSWNIVGFFALGLKSMVRLLPEEDVNDAE